MSRKLVLPFMVDDRLVVLLGVLTEKMASEIPIHSFPSIKVIGHTPRNIGLIGAIFFAACLLEGRVAIRNAVLTCITCTLSACFLFPLRCLEV